MSNLINRIKSNARGRNKSGNHTLALMVEAFEHLDGTKDWTPLAWIIGLAETSDQSRLRKVAEAAYPVTFKRDKKQPSGYRVKVDSDNASNMSRVYILEAAVSFGMTFRSKGLQEPFSVNGVDYPALIVREEKGFDPDTVRRAIRTGLDNGMTVDQITAMAREEFASFLLSEAA